MINIDNGKKIGVFSIVMVLVLVFGGLAIAESESSEEQEVVKEMQPSCQQGACGGNCDGSCGGNCGVKTCGCRG